MKKFTLKYQLLCIAVGISLMIFGHMLGGSKVVSISPGGVQLVEVSELIETVTEEVAEIIEAATEEISEIIEATTEEISEIIEAATE